MSDYAFRRNEVVLIGDTHSTDPVWQFINSRIPESSDIVHVGDIGLGFGDAAYALQNAASWLDRLNKICVVTDCRLFIVRGNHDNPDVWKFDNLSNVFLIQTGDTAVFPNGKKVLFLCGGISVDRCTRTIGKDYWPDEVTPRIDITEKYDIVFSHDAPEEFNHSTLSLPIRFQWAIDKDPALIEDCIKQRDLMSDLVKQSGANTLFYGHFHNQRLETVDGVYGRCVDINELYFFDAKHDYI